MASPVNVPDLALRFRASDLTGADGSAVSSWASSVGTSTASQGGAAATPTLVKADANFNGKSSVNFDGVDDWLTLNGDALSFSSNVPGITGFAVARMTGTGTVARRFFTFSTTSSGSTRASMDRGTADEWRMQGRRLDADSLQSQMSAPASASPSVVTGVWDYANAKIHMYHNGGTRLDGVVFQTAGNTSATNSAACSIGASSSGGNSFFLGQIAEIIIYKRMLTASERAEVHSYIQDEYAITVSDYVSGTPAFPWLGTPPGRPWKGIGSDTLR